MKQLADGLYLLRGFPPNAINVYLLHDVLIDAGTRQAEGRIMRQIRGRTVTAHALTHAHPDHQGASHAICQRLDIPLWCGHGDVLNGMNVMTGIRGLQEPPAVFTPDPARNRQSARRLAALEPQLVCFGHGPPLRDRQALQDFISQMPD